jgi:hypothetical protein
MPRLPDARSASTTVLFFVLPGPGYPPPVEQPDIPADIVWLAALPPLKEVAAAYGAVPKSLRPFRVFLQLGDGTDQTALDENADADMFDWVIKETVNPVDFVKVQNCFVDMIRQVFQRCESLPNDEEDTLASTPVGEITPLPWTHGGVAPRFPPFYRPESEGLGGEGRPAPVAAATPPLAQEEAAPLPTDAQGS